MGRILGNAGPQVNAHDLVPLPLQEEGRYGGIHTAGHGCEDLHDRIIIPASIQDPMYEFLLALPPTDTPPAAPDSGGGLGSMLPMLLLMGVVFYFFLIRPANKKEKTRREMLKSLRKHDRVVTSGGIHGTVTTIDDKQETASFSQ